MNGWMVNGWKDGDGIDGWWKKWSSNFFFYIILSPGIILIFQQY